MMIKRTLVALMVVALCAAMARAGLSATGDVIPADPATWTTSTDAYIGETGEGSVTVDDDSDLVSRYGYLGYGSGSTGAVTVTGAGSTWTNSSYLHVGSSGSATLNITDSGTVSSYDGYIGYYAGSTGTVTVSGAASTWTFGFWGCYVGLYGSGTLDITTGAAVSGYHGYIGYQSGSTGTVTVSEAGSTWKTPAPSTLASMAAGHWTSPPARQLAVVGAASATDPVPRAW